MNTYRFRGQMAPKDRAPLRAEVVAKKDGNSAMIRLYDVIDSWGGPWGVSAKEFADALDELGDVGEIDLHLNSPGGEAMEGIAILNVLRSHPARVVVTVDGLAASAASFIAVGADETIMARNSQMMIHDAWGLCVGNAKDMADLAANLDKLSNNIAGIYADKAGGTVGQWRDAMIAETWYNADEVVEAGLADSVIAKDDEPAQNRFDLTMFAHEGREHAPDPFIPSKHGDPENAAAPAAANSPVTAALLAGLSEAEAVLALA